LERAAAVTIATLPGATLWHEGQFEGRRVRVPVFLARRPDEPPNQELAAWYRNLVRQVGEHRVRTGAWQLLQAAGWPDNQSAQSLIAWCWTPGDDAGDVRRHVVVVNLAQAAAQAQIALPWPDLPGRSWRLTDLLSGEDFIRDGGELASQGLYVDLQPGQFYLLAVDAR
jgi:hypothetical protein